MVAATAYGVRHVVRDVRLELSKYNEYVGNGDKTNAKATLDALIITLQAVQTATNAATAATMSAATVQYTPPVR